MQDAKVETRDVTLPDQDDKHLAASHMLDCVHDCLAAKGENRAGRVSGIGGVFFGSDGDVKALDQWYEKNLGINFVGKEKDSESGYAILKWSDDKADDGGVTFWEPVNGEKASKIFGSSNSDYLVSYRVDNLEKIYERLKQNAKNGEEVPAPQPSEKGGMSLSVTDPNGHRIELWEPKHTAANGDNGSGRVLAVGGVYFRSHGDPKVLDDWYEKNIGLHTEEGADHSRFATLKWSDDKAAAADGGTTAWRTDEKIADWFAPSKSDFMIDYRVDNLEEIYERLKANGETIVRSPGSQTDIECAYYGKFLRVMDPDGNKVELWEPHKDLQCP